MVPWAWDKSSVIGGKYVWKKRVIGVRGACVRAYRAMGLWAGVLVGWGFVDWGAERWGLAGFSFI